jgi:hypothetical protein
LPRAVFVSSDADVRQRMPIRKIAKAIKKEWIYMSCLLIRLSEFNSIFQLKYLGKTTWIDASMTRRIPIILRCNSID